MLIHVVKAILVALSGYMFYGQYKIQNSNLMTYWFFVTAYWTINLIQGLI